MFDNLEEKQIFMNTIYKSIKTKFLRDYFKEYMKTVPEYFWHKPSSSTGKYHNRQDCSENGLVKHSLATFKIMNYFLDLAWVKEELFNDKPEMVYIDEYCDLLRIAAFIHDTWKYGEPKDNNQHTIFDHAWLTSKKAYNVYLTNYFIIPLCELIKSHHGEWRIEMPNDRHEEMLQLPFMETFGQKLLHTADYLASRQDIYMELPEFNEV